MIELEPDHIPALLHLARLAAWQGATARLKYFAERIRSLQPAGDRLLEIQALEAFALGDAERRFQALDALRGALDLTLLLSLWDIATFTGADTPSSGVYQGAIQVAALATEATHSPEMNVAGYLASGHLHLAAGCLSEGRAALRAAARIDPLVAAEYQAYFALHPLLSSTTTDLLEVRRQLDEVQARVVQNATPNVFLAVHNIAQQPLRLYLLGRLSLLLGEQNEAQRLLEELRAFAPASENRAEADELIQDLDRGLSARLALEQGDQEAALALLRAVQEREVWYGWTTVSPFFSRSAERFLLAETLAEAGSFDEALELFGSFAEHSLYDLIYLAPAHFRRAEIFDTLGRKDLAAYHDGEFLRLWGGCDAEVAEWVELASARLAANQGL